jgi:hypothetical protein
MRVTLNRYDKGATTDLADLIVQELRGDDYYRGELESARATADNATAALGKLVTLLVAKGVIALADVSEICYGLEDLEIPDGA